MAGRRAVLLTGATGLVGQYLLRNLLETEHQVAVLARARGATCAGERIRRIVHFWSEFLHRKLRMPIVFEGELGMPGPCLGVAERGWLARHACAVLHGAANLSFRNTPAGEPWRTNVNGTRSLLSVCRGMGLSEWHQVSTAFVCGRRTGIFKEEDSGNSLGFHNPYEASKWYAERLVRATSGIRTTVYRPSIIVGDSRTGHTSAFHGLYRFLELAVRLASTNKSTGAARLPLRLPLTGDEAWNLVPVNWVAHGIVDLVGRPAWHGRTFHLVSVSPVTTRFVRDLAVELLNLRGVEFAGSSAPMRATDLERHFLDGIREYWPYLGGSPAFDCANTATALADLPPPVIDRPTLERLIRYAAAHRWGQRTRRTCEAAEHHSARSRCTVYIEDVFPRQARQSQLAREAGLDLAVGIDIRGPGGGQWSCRWIRGEFTYVRSGLEENVTVIYRTDPQTFESIVSGAQTPQQAFFEQRVAITGDLEIALKLAVLFGQFLTENPAAKCGPLEVADASH
jgi:nucleoside-diphosphate-sugar epimerase